MTQDPRPAIHVDKASNSEFRSEPGVHQLQTLKNLEKGADQIQLIIDDLVREKLKLFATEHERKLADLEAENVVLRSKLTQNSPNETVQDWQEEKKDLEARLNASTCLLGRVARSGLLKFCDDGGIVLSDDLLMHLSQLSGLLHVDSSPLFYTSDINSTILCSLISSSVSSIQKERDGFNDKVNASVAERNELQAQFTDARITLGASDLNAADLRYQITQLHTELSSCRNDIAFRTSERTALLSSLSDLAVQRASEMGRIQALEEHNTSLEACLKETKQKFDHVEAGLRASAVLEQQVKDETESHRLTKLSMTKLEEEAMVLRENLLGLRLACAAKSQDCVRLKDDLASARSQSSILESELLEVSASYKKSDLALDVCSKELSELRVSHDSNVSLLVSESKTSSTWISRCRRKDEELKTIRAEVEELNRVHDGKISTPKSASNGQEMRIKELEKEARESETKHGLALAFLQVQLRTTDKDLSDARARSKSLLAKLEKTQYEFDRYIKKQPGNSIQVANLKEHIDKLEFQLATSTIRAGIDANSVNEMKTTASVMEKRLAEQEEELKIALEERDRDAPVAMRLKEAEKLAKEMEKRVQVLEEEKAAMAKVAADSSDETMAARLREEALEKETRGKSAACATLEAQLKSTKEEAAHLDRARIEVEEKLAKERSALQEVKADKKKIATNFRNFTESAQKVAAKADEELRGLKRELRKLKGGRVEGVAVNFLSQSSSDTLTRPASAVKSHLPTTMASLITPPSAPMEIPATHNKDGELHDAPSWSSTLSPARFSSRSRKINAPESSTCLISHRASNEHQTKQNKPKKRSSASPHSERPAKRTLKETAMPQISPNLASPVATRSASSSTPTSKITTLQTKPKKCKSHIPKEVIELTDSSDSAS